MPTLEKRRTIGHCRFSSRCLNIKAMGSFLTKLCCPRLAPTLEEEAPRRKLSLPLEVFKHQSDVFSPALYRNSGILDM